MPGPGPGFGASLGVFDDGYATDDDVATPPTRGGSPTDAALRDLGSSVGDGSSSGALSPAPPAAARYERSGADATAAGAASGDPRPPDGAADTRLPALASSPRPGGAGAAAVASRTHEPSTSSLSPRVSGDTRAPRRHGRQRAPRTGSSSPTDGPAATFGKSSLKESMLGVSNGGLGSSSSLLAAALRSGRPFRVVPVLIAVLGVLLTALLAEDEKEVRLARARDRTHAAWRTDVLDELDNEFTESLMAPARDLKMVRNAVMAMPPDVQNHSAIPAVMPALHSVQRNAPAGTGVAALVFVRLVTRDDFGRVGAELSEYYGRNVAVWSPRTPLQGDNPPDGMEQAEFDVLSRDEALVVTHVLPAFLSNVMVGQDYLVLDVIARGASHIAGMTEPLASAPLRGNNNTLLRLLTSFGEEYRFWSHFIGVSLAVHRPTVEQNAAMRSPHSGGASAAYDGVELSIDNAIGAMGYVMNPNEFFAAQLGESELLRKGRAVVVVEDVSRVVGYSTTSHRAKLAVGWGSDTGPLDSYEEARVGCGTGGELVWSNQFQPTWDDATGTLDTWFPKEHLAACRTILSSPHGLRVSAMYNYMGRLWVFHVGTTDADAGVTGELTLEDTQAVELLWAVGLSVSATLLLALSCAVASLIEMTINENERGKRRAAEAARIAHEETVSYACHELRNPLHVLSATTDFVQGDLADLRKRLAELTAAPGLADAIGALDATAEDLGTIQQSGKLMQAVVDDLLDLAKLRRGQLEIVPTAVRLRALVTGMVSAHRAMAKVPLFQEVSPDVPDSCFVDELRLRQVLQNGITNACKYVTEGSITLSVAMAADAEGTPMPPADSASHAPSASGSSTGPRGAQPHQRRQGSERSTSTTGRADASAPPPPPATRQAPLAASSGSRLGASGPRGITVHNDSGSTVHSAAPTPPRPSSVPRSGDLPRLGSTQSVRLSRKELEERNGLASWQSTDSGRDATTNGTARARSAPGRSRDPEHKRASFDPRRRSVASSHKVGVEGANDMASYVLFAVKDTGPGLPEGVDVAKLFNPFYQGEGARAMRRRNKTMRRSRGHAGTGLGLAIAYQLVNLMGGKIGLEERTDTRGARFWFTLPIFMGSRSTTGTATTASLQVPSLRTAAANGAVGSQARSEAGAGASADEVRGAAGASDGERAGHLAPPGVAVASVRPSRLHPPSPAFDVPSTVTSPVSAGDALGQPSESDVDKLVKMVEVDGEDGALASGAVDGRFTRGGAGPSDGAHGAGLEETKDVHASSARTATQPPPSGIATPVDGSLGRSGFTTSGGDSEVRAGSVRVSAADRSRDNAVAAAIEVLAPGAHFLICDDERINRRVAARFLKELKCTSAELEDGDEVEPYLKAHHPSAMAPPPAAGSEAALADTEVPLAAILMDISMQRTRGDEVVKDLLSRGLRVPVIACTGNASEPEVSSYRAAGFAAVLTKPFSLADVASVLMHTVMMARHRAGSAGHVRDTG